MRARYLLAAALACACGLYAQPPADPSVKFEVASVKPGSGTDHPAIGGGPGSPTPGQMTYTRISIGQLIASAYGVNQFQYKIDEGGPTWSIVAKLPMRS